MFKQSPNYTKGNKPKTVVVLHLSKGNFQSNIDWLTNKKSKVSAHIVISKKGEICRMIRYSDNAWHAGNIYNPSERAKKVLQTKLGVYINPNKYTIAIEFEANEYENEITEKQIDRVCEEIIEISKMDIGFKLKRENIITHKDIANYKPILEKTRKKILDKLFEQHFMKELKRDKRGGFWFVKQGDNGKQKILTNNSGVAGLLTVMSREFGVETVSDEYLKQLENKKYF